MYAIRSYYECHAGRKAPDGTMTGPEREDGAPWRNFYGRRHGKTLRKGQRELLDTRLAGRIVAGTLRILYAVLRDIRNNFV